MRISTADRVLSIHFRRFRGTLTDIHRAVKWFYLLRTAFGGQSVNCHFGYGTDRASRLDITELESRVLDIHRRLAKVTIESLPCLPRALDPELLRAIICIQINDICKPVELRNHPLVSANWPPVWTPGALKNAQPVNGEIGVLRHVAVVTTEPHCRLHLVIEHEGVTFTGALPFDDLAFCKQLERILSDQLGKTIEAIGRLEVSTISKQ